METQSYRVKPSMLIILLQRIFQVRVLETEISLYAGAPASFIIKVDVRPLFVLISSDLGFFVTLKPSHVLLVKSPALLFELPRCKILLIGALRVVEDKEQRVRSKFLKNLWVLKDCRWRRRIRRGCGVRVLRCVSPGAFIVCRRRGHSK